MQDLRRGGGHNLKLARGFRELGATSDHNAVLIRPRYCAASMYLRKKFTIGA